MKKIIIISWIFFIILSMFSNVLATELKTKLNIIKQNSETVYLDDNQGYITKKIVDSNSDIGEVTVELGLSNIRNVSNEEKKNYEDTEIYIIVNENLSHSEEDLNKYISYIETLVTKIFEKNSNTQIGIVGIKGTISDFTIDEDGNAIIGEKDEGDVEGTAENAEIVVGLTKNIEDIKNGLKNMNSTKIKYSVNLQAAIKLANKSFSNNVNKLLISLYDGVPDIAIGVASQVSYGGIFSEYLTIEEAIIAKHKNISNKTKSEILNLMKSNVNFILLRPDDTSYDQKWYNTTTGEYQLEFDGSPYVKEIYGTLENPTYGKMYSLNNDNLEKIVTEYIYQDIIEEIGTDIKSAVIKEYFSDKILNNFDITFNNGNIDTTNLLTDKFITWNIGDLATNKTANLKYTLKIKDMKNSDLLNKVLSTSEKTNFSYINKLNQETEKEATDSPKIQLLEIKEELIATVTYDPTYTTTGTVIATINTNKKVNKVEGWTLSENGQTLTKQYSKNTTEIVHLVDIDNMTKDVEVKITNIQVNNNDNNYNNNDNVKDDTTASGRLPQAGISIGIIIVIVLIALCGIYTYLKQHNLRDI